MTHWFIHSFMHSFIQSVSQFSSHLFHRVMAIQAILEADCILYAGPGVDETSTARSCTWSVVTLLHCFAARHSKHQVPAGCPVFSSLLFSKWHVAAWTLLNYWHETWLMMIALKSFHYSRLISPRSVKSGSERCQSKIGYGHVGRR